MRILLTGATGQFGQAFREAATKHELILVGHRQTPDQEIHAIDLEQPSALAALIQAKRPTWVVHAAALTNVDECEKEPAKAERVNGSACGDIAKASKAAGARLALISTDYVFDGSRGDYKESDATGPINEYGKSKLSGERHAHEHAPEALICRTSVVFGPHKNNFVQWCAKELSAQRTIRVVTDQRVCPTYTHDSAHQVLSLVERGEKGIYHTAGATPLSRYEMAQQVAHAFGLDASRIQATTSDQLTWTARRPLDTTLSTAKVAKIQPPMPFADALAHLRTRWRP